MEIMQTACTLSGELSFVEQQLLATMLDFEIIFSKIDYTESVFK
jgi:hypothetical protein